MEVDGIGNIHVAGESYGAGTQSDFLLVKYAPAHVVAPTAFSVPDGVIADGDRGSLLASDDNRLVVHPETGPSRRAQVRIRLEGVSPIASPSMMGFRLEASASTVTLTQQLYLYDFQAQGYEKIDATTSTLSDSVREIAAAGALQRFVENGTRAVTALITFRATGPAPDYP